MDDEKIPRTIYIYASNNYYCKRTNMALVEHNRMFHAIELCLRTEIFHRSMFEEENSKQIDER
jgi:hypothetical protein